MNNNMMVKPAECGEVFGIGRATLRPGENVMRLESIATGATVCGATSVAMHDESLEFLGDNS